MGMLPLLLVLGVLWPSPAPLQPAAEAAPAAPWDGIVGFLQTVAQLQDRRPDPESTEDYDDGKPMRKIVYAVEEQVVSGGDAGPNESVIVYDSLRDGEATTPHPVQGADSDVVTRRDKRSTEINSNSTSVLGKELDSPRSGNLVHRPFLIGRRLWYVPLWFSIYLILYITALTVKSVARHKIKYPTLVSEDALFKRRNGYTKIDKLTRRITNAVSNGERRYQSQWSM